MRRFSLALVAVAVGALLFGLIAGGTAMGKKPKKHAEVVLLETKNAAAANACLATAGSNYLKENDGPKSKGDKGVTDEISREFPSKKAAKAAKKSAPQCTKSGKKVKPKVEKEE
jgi:hypothetical protein